MSRTVRSCVLTLALLLVWRAEETAEACSCSPAHPQQAFCNSDVVIRAKLVERQEIVVGNDIYGNPVKQIKFGIKQMKMFKGPNQDIDAIYTPLTSAGCGVSLQADGKEYLITGKLKADGTLHVTLCDFIKLWESTSATQKKSLTQRYEMGCDCKITRCTSIPCLISSPSECLWTDWVMEKSVYGQQAKHFACIKRSDDSCAWYRGLHHPKRTSWTSKILNQATD